MTHSATQSKAELEAEYGVTFTDGPAWIWGSVGGYWIVGEDGFYGDLGDGRFLMRANLFQHPGPPYEPALPTRARDMVVSGGMVQ